MKHRMRMKTGVRRKRGGIWRRWLAGLLAAVMLAELVPVYARDAADGQAAESSHATVYDGGQSAADGSKSAAQDGRKNTAQASGQAGDQAVTLARREDALSKVGSTAVQTKHRAAADAAGAKSTDASNAADASSAGEDAPTFWRRRRRCGGKRRSTSGSAMGRISPSNTPARCICRRQTASGQILTTN